jgi:hypothetical protein
VNEKADQLLSRMTDDEWTELILHLGRYALRTSGNLRWRTGNKRELPGGETAGSIVSKAIEKVFSGERKWDPEANPSLRKYLMDVIDSLFSQLVNGEDNKKFEIILDRHDEDGNLLSERQTRHPNASAEWLARPPLTPEEEMLVQEQNQRNEEALGALVDDCDDDPVLRKVLEAMFDGDETPRSIADKKGLTRQEVYAASKRLDTKIAALKKRFVVGTTLPVLKGKQND